VSDQPEKESIAAEVGGWIWGTIEGGFNEKQSISQIIVDAAIGMIPVVGDVTAARDLIAVILRLIDDPKKREDKLEWLTLVLLIFALLPVAGGVIKGVGKLVIKAGEDVGRHAELVRDIIQFLNRVGEGDAIKFFKALNFEEHTAELLGKWRNLVQTIDEVIGATIRRAHVLIPDAMIERLRSMQEGIRKLKDIGERMIPESLKELNRRLKLVQKALYEGEWHAIPKNLTSTTREAEARLVETIDKDGNKVKQWTVADRPHPPNTVRDFTRVEGWPDLAKPPYVNAEGAFVIESFSGTMRPVLLKKGTKIRRIVTAKSNPAGLFWAYELPRDGAAWRKDYAVLDRFSGNGFYVEHELQQDVRAWEGTVSSQVDNAAQSATFGQVLPGGAVQLVIDFTEAELKPVKALIDKSPRIPTHWNNFSNINVPAKNAQVQKLGYNEIEPKLPGQTAAAAGARGARAGDSDEASAP
jgi:hypothetical protein